MAISAKSNGKSRGAKHRRNLLHYDDLDRLTDAKYTDIHLYSLA